MTDWESRFLALAEHIASWSKDPSTKVGAVIVDCSNRVVGVGYNGFPRGIADTDGRLSDRETKYRLVVHAEANAILNASGSVRGCRMYTNLLPCTECAKLIIQSGILSVVSPKLPENLVRWQQNTQHAIWMLEEAGRTVIIHE